MQHLALPLRLDSTGRLAVVAQNSPEDVAQSVGVLVATRPFERVAVPGYGTPDPQADGPNLTATRAAVEHWEPRAGTVDLTLTVDGATVTVDVSVEG